MNIFQEVGKGYLIYPKTPKYIFFAFFCSKIWSVQKKAVLLPPLLKRKHANGA